MLSKISYFICICILLSAAFYYPRWEKKSHEATISWDVAGYYWYLPSIFIYKDLKQQEFALGVQKKYHLTSEPLQGFKHPSGNYVLTYTSGMALVYSPFFAVAHVLAKPLGYPADGFSKPYMVAISMASLLVAFVGLWYFRKLLKYYVSDTATAIMLLLLVAGSNYLNYTAIDGAQTHNWLFTIYVFLLLNTRNFYQTLKIKYAAAIGILCGLAILIRPSEIISILIPILWGMESISISAIKKQLAFLLKQIKPILIAMSCIMLIGSIQLIYWKYASGQWLVYSYEDKGFSWLHPHFKDYIFSYRSGWITYTPLMLFAFIGIIPFLKYGQNKVAILTFFALNLYIVSAWDVWWYGGTGGRAMIQSYPIILLPFATLIEYILSRPFWKWIVTPFFLIFTYCNVWFIIQSHGGQSLYDPECMTREYFWSAVGRWHVPDDVIKLKDSPERFLGTPKSMQTIYQNNFETDTTALETTSPISGTRSVYLDKDHQTSTLYEVLYNGNAQWARATATFRIAAQEIDPWSMTQFVFRFSNNEEKLQERMIRVHRLLDSGATKTIYIDSKIPAHANKISVQFWNAEGRKKITIDNLSIQTFNE